MINAADKSGAEYSELNKRNESVTGKKIITTDVTRLESHR